MRPRMALSWPVICRTHSPDAMSQVQMSPSPPPLNRFLPSGSTTKAFTVPLCPFNTYKKFPSDDLDDEGITKLIVNKTTIP